MSCFTPTIYKEGGTEKCFGHAEVCVCEEGEGGGASTQF